MGCDMFSEEVARIQTLFTIDLVPALRRGWRGGGGPMPPAVPLACRKRGGGGPIRP